MKKKHSKEMYINKQYRFSLEKSTIERQRQQQKHQTANKTDNMSAN